MAVINGTEGDDVLQGTDLEDEINGLGGNDTIDGGRGNDVINGGAGNDIIIGNFGADIIDGGDGDDTLTGDSGWDILLGGAGQDSLFGSEGNDTLDGGAGDDNLDGGAGEDTLIGGLGADTIHGGGGFTDIVDYSESNFRVIVNLGTGEASGGHAQGDVITSVESVIGSAFNDTLSGNASTNTLFGGLGNDLLDGRAGADILQGGDGSDTATYALSSGAVTVNLATNTGIGGDANGDVFSSIENIIGSAFGDTITGDSLVNWLKGGDGADRLSGGDGDDSLWGEEGNDILIGDAGGDYFLGGAGADTLDGGEGHDTADYFGSAAGVTINLALGTGSGGDAEGDILISIEEVRGTEFDDVLVGDEFGNRFLGGAGDDTLIGGAGADSFNGHSGADILDGGADFDSVSYWGSPAGVTINLTTGTGSGGEAEGDQLISIEQISLTKFDDQILADLNVGAPTYSLLGDDGNDALAGGDNDDWINGHTGDDILDGRGGADNIDGGPGIDTATYAASASAVTVDLAAGTGIGGDAEGDTLTTVENLIGSNHDDELSGDDGANDLRGGAGDDLLEGRAGADALDGGSDGDTASYEDSDTAVVVSLASGTGSGGHAEGDTLTAIEHLQGSVHDDTLIGNAEDNQLDGKSGDDLLEGGGGADNLDGGSGIDTASYAGSSSAVTVKLWNGTGSGGDAAGDTLTSVENLIGSAFNDTLVGDNSGNFLQGGDGNDRLFGSNGDDILEGSAGSDRLDGGAGSDTASYAGSSAGVTVKLWNGTGTGGDAAGDIYVSIENLAGSNFSDTLVGNNAANVLTGGAGADRLFGSRGDDILEGGSGGDNLDGGSGNDTASYAGSTAGVTVKLWNGTGSGGDAEGDTLTSIENLTGSDFNDTLVGDSGVNWLEGGSGNDRLFGDNGDDTLRGGGGNDRLFAGGGNDILEGGAGGDVLDGGAGDDTINYAGSSAGVTLNLATGAASGGDASGDSLTSIEHIIGSTFADSLTGDSGNNILEGGAGGDTLNGGSGADTVSYAGSSAGVAINLATATASGGDAAGDSLTSIEHITGSAFDDVLVGYELGQGESANTAGALVDIISQTPDTREFLSSTFVLKDGSYMLVWMREPEPDSPSESVAQFFSADNIALGGTIALPTLSSKFSLAELVDGRILVAQFGAGNVSDLLLYTIDPTDNSVSSTTAFENSRGIADVAALPDGGYVVGHWVKITVNNGGLINPFTTTHNLTVQVFNADGTARSAPHIAGISLDPVSGSAAQFVVQQDGSFLAILDGRPNPRAQSYDQDGNPIGDLFTIFGPSGENVTFSDIDPAGGFVAYSFLSNTFFWYDADGIPTGRTLVDEGHSLIDVGSDLSFFPDGSFLVTHSFGFDTGSDFLRSVFAELFDASGQPVGQPFLVDIGGEGTSYTVTLLGSSEVLFQWSLNLGSPDFETAIEFLQVNAVEAATDTTFNSNRLIGGAGNDIIEGRGGNDHLEGGTGDDQVSGGTGHDFITGGPGQDTLSGGDGNDFLEGGAGGDVLDGGDDEDTASYTESPSGVIVKLWNGTGSGGDAQGDTLWGVENLIGSAFNDTLVGNNAGNILQGGGGNDRLFGSNGDDTLEGGAGADKLFGGEGIDSASYAGSAAGVTVKLWNGTGSGGDAMGDSFTSIENLTGSGHHDTLVGDNTDNLLSGGGGNDRLFGGGGNDILRGGTGDDRLFGQAGADTFVFDGDWGDDTIGDFEDGADLLDFSGSGRTFGDLTISQVASDTLIEDAFGNSVTLTGITATDITADDFLF